MGQQDPAVLYMLARQQYGGLTAVKPEVLDVFSTAQAILSAHISQEQVAFFGAKAFARGHDAARADELIVEAFARVVSANRPSPLGPVNPVDRALLLQMLMDKIFNSAAAEFCEMVTSIWGKDAKYGTNIRQELKAMQKTKATSIEKQNPVKINMAKILEMPAERRHLQLRFITEFHPAVLEKKACTITQLKSILKLYVHVEKVKLSGLSKTQLADRVIELLKKSTGAAAESDGDDEGDGEGDGEEGYGLKDGEAEEEEEEQEEGGDEADGEDMEGLEEGEAGEGECSGEEG
jgi:hypothetical protein